MQPQRPRHVGTRRGSRRRRGHAAARQDRHDHPGQPHGHRVHPGAGCHRRGTRRRRAAGLARRRDAGRPLDRRARQGVRPARSRGRPREGDVRPVHRADAHERRRSRRTTACARAPRRHRSPGSASRAATVPPRTRVYAGAGLRPGRHAARRRPRRHGARRDPPQGHRQGRHPRALRPAAQDGHPHRDDHRRQPAHRRRHRRRSRRGRLHGPGHARKPRWSASATSRRRASSSP